MIESLEPTLSYIIYENAVSIIKFLSLPLVLILLELFGRPFFMFILYLHKKN